MAEWLGRGLQSLVQRFESARRLYPPVDAGLASLGDLARMLAATGRDEDALKLRRLRRLIELTRGRRLER